MFKNLLTTKFFWVIFSIYQIFVINSLVYSYYFHFLSLLVFILNVCPLINYYFNYKSIDKIPLYYFTHVYFLMCYTFCLLFPSSIIDILGQSFMNIDHSYRFNVFYSTVEIFIIGLFFFNLGNYLIKFILKKKIKSPDSFKFSDNPKEILFLGIISYLFVIIFYFKDNFEILQKLYQIKFSLTYLSVLSFQLYLFYEKKVNILIKIFLYSLILLIIFIELLSGGTTFAFLIIIAVYLLNFLHKKKLYLKTLLIMIVVFSTLHAYKYEYRNLIWGSAQYNSTLSQYAPDSEINKQDNKKMINKAWIYINTYIYSISNLKNSGFKPIKNRNLNRIFHSFKSLMVITHLSPDVVPYWNGHSYKIFTSRLIPRIFWKNKPQDTLGNEFGRRYKVLSQDDSNTSWNVPVLNEMYANFGIYGVAIGMLIFGMIFRFIPYFFNFNHNNYLFLITFIGLYPFFFLEAHLSLYWGGAIQQVVFLFLYIFFIKKILTKKFL